MQDTTRRHFLAAASAIAGSGVVPAAGIAATLEASPSIPHKWTMEADVVVVGSGAAGLSAAIAAKRAGASVIIIEKAGAVGGTTIKSDAAYWIPNNHMMKAKAMSDPRDDAINYMARHSYPISYRSGQPQCGLTDHAYSLIAAYYDSAAEVIEDLEQAGILKSTMYMLCDYYDHSTENKAPRGRILAPRTADGTPGNGIELISQLSIWIEQQKIPVLTRHAVTNILTNSAKEAIGVELRNRSGNQAIRARKAVIFGSGGFTQNKELLEAYQPGPIYGGCAIPTNQGDFIKIGSRLGVKLGNMVNAWRAQIVLEEAIATPSVARDVWAPPGDSMILINKYGRRVVNEKRNYNDRTRLHFAWDANEAEYPNQFLFMVFDQRSLELYAGNYPLPEPGESSDYIMSAGSLPELATILQQRLDALAPNVGIVRLAESFNQGLADQINEFNGYARDGVDHQFRRGEFTYDREWHTIINSVPRKDTKWPQAAEKNVTLHPFADNGPFHAIILAAGNLDTNGGPVTNAGAQVLNADGNAISGLFGAGNCVASAAGQAYWGAGSTIGPALTFGTIAGRLAATEALKAES